MSNTTHDVAFTLDQAVWHGDKITARQWVEANVDAGLRDAIRIEAIELTQAAYDKGDAAAENRVHDILGRIYEQDFNIPCVEQVESDTQPILRDIASILEHAV